MGSSRGASSTLAPHDLPSKSSAGEIPSKRGRQWIIVNPLARSCAIGDPCAGQRWQDHHDGVVVFLIDIVTHLTLEMFA